MAEDFFSRWERTIKQMPRDRRPPDPDPMILTTATEIIFGGIRLSPGTYQVRRIADEDVGDEPAF